ncbi:unnamed protein product [Lactuca saligna]|uniref:Uncharacterized protein n=1 Tax=Lactuca saligna TaxID=75948 RepID=A0AA35ZNF5_LACSI|nr:unnamed protein product [Lactuca saligna]
MVAVAASLALGIKTEKRVSLDRVRVRGRSPAFNALASTFENANARNLSTPPPLVRKSYPKSGATNSPNAVVRSTAITSLTATFEQLPPREPLMPRSVKRISIGIVTAIAAPASIRVDFGGNGGHARAALMPQRNDAGLATAKRTLAVENMFLNLDP